VNSESRDVYFGSSNPPTLMGNQSDTIFHPGELEFNTTYYWKINEKNSDGTQVGDVWSFTSEIGFSNAAFVSHVIPEDTIGTSESQVVAVTLKNTGERTWDASKGFFSLRSQNPENNNYWGISKVLLVSEELVLPGDEKTFIFQIAAPDLPGDYNFQWMMQNQEGWFGNPTDNVVINVQSTVGINDQREVNPIVISNPANSGKIMVQVAYIKEPLVISVFSMEGRIVHQTKSSALLTEINIADFDSGMYLVKVQSGEEFNKALILLE
jgi:hypothetical protein